MRNIILMVALLSAQVLAAGQQGVTNDQRPVATADAQIMTEVIQVSDPITVSNKMIEATVAVLPPKANSACTNGRVFFGSGSFIESIDLNAGPLLVPKLTDMSAQFDTTGDLSAPFVSADNHLVATRDGQLIYTIMGVIWKDNISPHPEWWSQTKKNTLKNKKVEGGRGAIFVFRSTNCGDTWSRMPTIDAAKLKIAGEVGYCAWPRVNDEKQTAEAGGWDGHYLHADKFKGNVYITTPCTSGKGELGLVLMADQNLTSWKVVHQVNGAFFWRAPITTLSNGSVIIAYGNFALNKAFIGRSAAPGGAFDEKEVATLSIPSDIVSRAALPASMYAYTTLARITTRGTNGTKEGYQLATWFDSGGDMAYNIQRHEAAHTQNAGTMSGAKKGNSVLQGTFVEATGPEALGNDSPSIFYWLEQVGKGEFQVRFRPFIGGRAIADSESISDVFSTPTFTGDYLGGTSYRTATGLWKFYLSWSQSGSLRFAEVIIRVPDRRPIQNIVIKKVRPSLKIQPISAELTQKGRPVEVHSNVRPAVTKPARQ